MSFKLFQSNLVIVSSLISLTIGSSTSSFYHRRQIANQRKAFAECQVAWERYYSLSNQTKTVQSLDPNQSFWQVIKHQLITVVQTKAQDFNQPFNLDQQKYLVYQYEVLPKCNKLKAWVKQMNSLDKNKV